jgi:hypothetical protein
MTALTTIGPADGADSTGEAPVPTAERAGPDTAPGAAPDDVDHLRRAACSVRRRVIRQLPEVLERFADEVLALGGHVCWAHTATDARHYIANVAVRHNARTVLRWTAPPRPTGGSAGSAGAPTACGGAGGSGALPVCGGLPGVGGAPVCVSPTPSGTAGAEGLDGIAGGDDVGPPLAVEVDVDRTIGYCQADVVATGLEEWIARLADDAPGDIVAAAGGRDRRGIPDLLVEQARVPGALRRRPAQLLRLARTRLRRQFLGAEVGVGTADLAVAETGSLVVVTDQATSRLAAVLPDVQVVVLGLDQVIAAWEQADLLVALHQRVAPAGAPPAGDGDVLGAGHASTTVLTGPRRPAELDGPRELHVVVLDNGRSRRLSRLALGSCEHPDTAEGERRSRR